MRWLCSDAAVSHFTFSDTESSENMSALACRYEMRFSVPAFEDDVDVSHSNLAASQSSVLYSFAKSSSTVTPRGLLTALCFRSVEVDLFEVLFA